MIELSEQQRLAVEYTGAPALVVAGAGSGKTRTLTAKIGYLVNRGMAPERILAITFTNKAAEEMKSRLEALTGLSSFRFPWVRTYHSACFQILKLHCHLLGYTPPLQIYASYQQQKLMKEILLGMNFDKKHVGAVISHISHAKNSGDPMRYFDVHPRYSHIRLHQVYERYEKDLLSRNAVDFDNILLMTRNLFRDHKAVRKHYQELFEFILVDEYQDSNNLQEELTRLLLRNGNLFCVGDDWQAIYGFRGSNIDHFLTFSDKFHPAKVFRLEQNYRSADEIVQIANDLIGFNEKKMEKKCFSDKRGGVVELHDFFDENQEARWICRKIQSLRGMGIPYHQMGVLYRTRFTSLGFERAFRTYGIPYQMLGAKGFFDRKEILDINCYLTAAVFPRDDVAFERILNTPKRGIGPSMIKKINNLRTGEMSLQDAARKVLAERIMTPKVHKAMSALIQGLDDIRDMAPDTAIHAVLSRFDYLEHLKAYTKSNSMDYIAREENIKQLLYSAGQHQTLLDYLEDTSLINEDRKDEEDEGGGHGVKLSTIHASKGLEYLAVFITGCEENLFPHWKSLETAAGLQEERRLMYVAVTRAERYLFLTCAEYRRGQSNPKSRFWDEIEAGMG